MDARSLDTAVQSALRALYPPFEATAPTVLGQVFRLLETSYRGDGLCCLLEFLIPAKRLFEHVRQAACAPYINCIFLHEGWPLCLHEKVVVHLAPLNPLLLRSGDFYLQAEPCRERSARITLKHLARDLRTVRETPVPEATYALLFTNEWLEEINCEHDGAPLHTCLVATEDGVAPLPWSRIATPEFVEQPSAGASSPAAAPGCGAPEAAAEPALPGAAGPLRTAHAPGPYSNVPGCKDAAQKPGQGKYPGLIKVDQLGPRKEPARLAVPSLREIVSQNLEGEYVDLLELSEEKLHLLAKCLPSAGRAGAEAALPRPSGAPEAGAGSCGRGPGSEGPCAPCLGRGLRGDPGCYGPRCRYRHSYLAALQNPVSFGPGLMAAILEEPDGPGHALPPAAGKSPAQRRRRAGPAGSPALLSRCPDGAAGPGPKAEEAAKPGNLKLLKSPARSEATGSSHKFSFLKGQRHGAPAGDGSAGDRAASHLEGPWKKMSAIYSPRMSRAKPAGKGPDPAAGAPAEDRPLQSAGGASGPSGPAAGREPGAPRPPAWQELHAGLLLSGVVCLPGSTDRLGRALIQVTTSGRAWEAAWCSAGELARLILYFCSVARKEVKESGLTMVVDARKQPASPVLYAALRAVQSVAPGSIHAVLLLAEKELAAQREKLPGVQVETLPSLKALSRYVDSSQVTRDLDGSFPYRHSEWVQFFQKLHPFAAGLRQASALLRSCIQELRPADGPAAAQEAAACIARHKELMRRVLSDPQLVGLQRDGGAVLARLRREAARLAASPHVRSSLEAAEGLYSQLEEEVHDLVSKSNSCLERLEFLRKTRELEAEFGELGRWLDGEAAARLEEMGAQEWSPDGCEKPCEQFKEFLTQATARYNHGLALCQEAAEVQDSAFPEADSFQVAAALFRTKLMSFHAAVERRRAELEMLEELCRFSSKITWLNLDCKRCSACVKRGESQTGNLEVLQCLESSFQKLSVDFSLKKLQEMEAHVHAMRSSSGLGAWTAAWQRYQEARQVLEEMLAELQQAWAAGADGHGKGDAFDSSNAGPAAPGKAAPACKAVCGPAQGLSGSRRQEEARQRGAGRAAQPPGSSASEPAAGAGPSAAATCSARGSPRPSRGAAREGEPARRGRVPAGSSLRKPDSGACPRTGESLLGDLGQPVQGHPLALPPRAGCAGPDRPCPAAPSEPAARGALSAAGTPAEATQYFQVSSRSSLAVEDVGAQDSAAEPPAAGRPAPRDPPSGRPPCPSEKSPRIVYLENHLAASPARASAQ
ncbi:uncharacterized protein KIAA1755 homolog isoform X2 [Struthio camelus]|uniref:uncharacterized protein KIAA1755 homolog isoform X2 n=1 Tax=Struthio camelus TaxID=8801 RepID=UPI003603E034